MNTETPSLNAMDTDTPNVIAMGKDTPNANKKDTSDQKNKKTLNLDLYKAKEFTNTSDRSWQIFKNSGANFPSLHYVKQKRKKLNSILPVKLTQDGRQFSLFNFNFGFIDPVKPGFYEPNQSKNQMKKHLLNGKESLLNPNTVTGNFCLGSFNVIGETYESIKSSLSNLLEKLSLLNQLEVDGVKYNIEYWLTGDLKFISIILGIQAANGEYPCPWCTSSKKNFSCDTHEINRVFENQTLGIKGYKNEPILGFIKAENVIVDGLHLFLRISDKLEDLLQTDLIQMDNVGAFKIDIESNPNRKKYFDFLTQLNIKKPYYVSMKTPRNILARDLTGIEKLKLFNNINLAKLFPELSNVKLKQDTWMEFFDIINSIKKSETQNILSKTKSWFEKFSKFTFQNAITPYIHILISHLHRQVDYLKTKNLELNSFSCQGLEKYNDMCTQYYQKCTNKSETKMLQLVQKRNRLELLTYYENLEELFLIDCRPVKKTETTSTEPTTTKSTTTESTTTESTTTESTTTESTTTESTTTEPNTTLSTIAQLVTKISTRTRKSDFEKLDISKISSGIKKLKKNKKSTVNNSFFLLDNIEITSRSFKLKNNELLSDSHIDLALEFFQKNYPHVNIIYNFRMAKEIREKQLSFSLQNTENVIYIQHTKNHWITVTNINCQISKNNKNIFVYDSLNDPSYLTGLGSIFELMFRDSFVEVNQVELPFFQKGGFDCGLFSLAYVFLLCQNIEPSFVLINQSNLRKSYNHFISKGKYELDCQFMVGMKRKVNKYYVPNK